MILRLPETKRERDLYWMKKKLQVERQDQRIDYKTIGIQIKQERK